MILDADPKLQRHKWQALRQNIGLCWTRCRGDLTADYQTKYSESGFERNTQARRGRPRLLDSDADLQRMRYVVLISSMERVEVIQ